MTTGGLVAFVIGCIVRPDAMLGLVVLGALFVVLESVFPLRPQQVFRPGFATDCVHFVFDEVLAGLVLAGALLTVVPLLQAAVPDVVRHGIALQPRWVVVLEGLLLGEIAGYWGHRATHEVGFLGDSTDSTTRSRRWTGSPPTVGTLSTWRSPGPRWPFP